MGEGSFGRALVRRGLVHLSFLTVAVTQPLLQSYGGSLAMFTTARWQGARVVWFALVVALVPAAVVTVVEAAAMVLARRRERVSRAVHLVLVGICAWACTSLVLRSVSLGGWVLDAAFSLAVAVCVVGLYARWRAVGTWLALLSPLAPVVVAAFLVASWAVVRPATAAVPTEPATASPVDVVWIQLDEAPLFPLVGSDGEVNARRFPGFARLASVSTWYRNVLAVSQHTAVAVPAMLSGRAPDYGTQPVLADHPENIFTMLRSRAEMDVIEAGTSLCAEKWCVEAATVDEVVVVPGPTSTASFLRDAAVVLGHKLLPAGLREELPPIDETWGGFGADDDAPDATAPADWSRPLPPAGHEARFAALEAMIDRQATATEPAVRFMHLMLPHRPWVLAPDLRKSAKPISDPRPPSVVDRRRDGYQSHLNQYVALDAEIDRLLDVLVASPRWARTMLVVTADHGLTFVPGESYRDEVDPGNRPTLDDIYRVPLFVKYAGQTSGVVDDCAASVLDIVPTILAASGAGESARLDGSELAKCAPSRERTVTWPKGSATPVAGLRELKDRVAFYDKWVDADGDVDDIYRVGRAGSLLGSAVPATAESDSSITWRPKNAKDFVGVGAGRFAPVPTRAVGFLTTSRDIGWSEEVLVAVDGVFVGEMPEVSGMRAGATAYVAASVMSRLVAAGDHVVELWTATPSGDGFRLRRVVTP